MVNQFAMQERWHTVLRQQSKALDPRVNDADSSNDDPEIYHVMMDIPRHDNTFNLADLIGKYHDDPAMKVYTSIRFPNFTSELGLAARFCAETQEPSAFEATWTGL